MTEDRRGLNTDFAGNLLRFSTHTYTHKFGNHNSSYGHLKTAITWCFSGTARNQFSLNG
jgi:hypothetical protein